MNIRFILFCLFFGFAAQAYSAPDGHDSSVVVEDQTWTMAITEGEFLNIPNTAWQYAHLEHVQKIVMLPSKNTLFIDDDLGDRHVGLWLQSQRNRDISGPFVLLIRREGLRECDYDEGDEACVMAIRFNGGATERLPARVMSKGVVNMIYLYDDEFLAHLEAATSLTIEVPMSPGVYEEMIFDVRGFKQAFLAFFELDDAEEQDEPEA